MYTRVDNGLMLFDAIYVGDGNAPASSLLVLRIEQGSPVVYHKTEIPTVEYPGEYELAGYNIIAFTAKNSSLLNYIIRFSNQKIAYIQDEKAFEHDEITDMDKRLVTTEEMKGIIERRELGGTVQIIG